MTDVSSNQTTRFRRIPFTLNNRITEYTKFYQSGPRSPITLKDNVAGNGLAIFDIIIRQEYDMNANLRSKIKLNCTSQMFPEIEIRNCSAAIVERQGAISEVINFSPKVVHMLKEDTGTNREISSDAIWFHSISPLVYSERWLANGALNIRITGSIEYPIEETPALTKDLKTLLNDEETSDLKILVGEKVFYCHKNIYMCRSPVFKTMLTTDMKEKSENSVTITDTDPDTFEMFNQFLYTDTVSFDSPSTAPDLLYLAEKYDVESLKKVCEFEMIHNITTANCLDYCISAFTSDSQKLYEGALKFINRNLASLMKTEEWKKMKNYPDILMKLLGNVVENN